MITGYIVQVAVLLFTTAFSYLPDAKVLPTFGSVNLDALFMAGFGYVRFLASVFPPLTTIIECASIYITWRISLLVLKGILGHRTPVHN
jgi:hypothetical protein